jgi:hypothetical protein
MVSWGYLNPFLTVIFAPYERFQRMVIMLVLIYMSWIIFMLH